MTARWVVEEVQPARDLRITWQPISLFFKNQPEPATPHHERLAFTHNLLRVMESVRAAEGEAGVSALYEEYGRRIHHDRALPFSAADALAAIGHDAAHATAFDDDAWDDPIRTRMDIGLELAGDDIGTPIIAFEDQRGVKKGFFGPVITRVPDTDDSLLLWDALVDLVNVDGFWELKRIRTERPDFGARP